MMHNATIIGIRYKAYRVNADGTLHRSAAAARRYVIALNPATYRVSGGLILVGAFTKGVAWLDANGDKHFVADAATGG